MPLYSYRCTNCGTEFDCFNTVKDRENMLCLCGSVANKTFSQIAKPVIYEYYSENLGAVVTGPRQKQQLMREKGVKEAA